MDREAGDAFRAGEGQHFAHHLADLRPFGDLGRLVQFLESHVDFADEPHKHRPAQLLQSDVLKKPQDKVHLQAHGQRRLHHTERNILAREHLAEDRVDPTGR